MNNPEVEELLDDCQAELDHASNILQSLGMGSNIVPFVTRYSLIKACGTIEIASKSLIADRCSRRSKTQVKNFISKKIRGSSMNPSYSNICEMLGDFDLKWKENFKHLIDDHPDTDQLRAALKSLVDSRNQFAHGGNPSITLGDIRTHYAHSRILVEMIDGILN